MAGMKVILIRERPEPCPECGADVFTVYARECAPCRAIKYLNFRYAMAWPLDDLAKRNMGLIDSPPKLKQIM